MAVNAMGVQSSPQRRRKKKKLWEGGGRREIAKLSLSLFLLFYCSVRYSLIGVARRHCPFVLPIVLADGHRFLALYRSSCIVPTVFLSGEIGFAIHYIQTQSVLFEHESALADLDDATQRSSQIIIINESERCARLPSPK